MGNKDNYYYSNGQTIPLVPAQDVVAVKADEHISREPHMRAQEDGPEPILTLPKYGIKVYQREENERGERMEGMLSQAAPENTVAVFRQTRDNPSLMFATDKFLAQFKPEVTREQIDQLNAQHGVRIVEPLKYAENAYVLEAPQNGDTHSIVKTANAYYESGMTVFSHPDFIKERYFKQQLGTQTQVPVAQRDAEFLSQQWHLETTKVTEAWSITRGSRDIVVAILDDGVDVNHQEFRQKLSKQYDFESHVEDGNPKEADEKHGTACAGVAAAAGIKACGAAPECSLMAVRMPKYLGSRDEAEMFVWAADNGADVISCSWGPMDGVGQFDPLPDATRAAISYCIAKGRSGKGIPIFWAAGNGNESVTLDGYAANPDVVAVAASTSKEEKAWYSDFGKEIWICAPSSGNKAHGEKSIFTADRTRGAGYNPGDINKGDMEGDYTNSFGGTSSAAPLAAGIAALMLSANGSLTARQVREIMARTADRIGDQTSYLSGPLGLHSDYYGYGRINAEKAVQEAKNMSSGTRLH